MKDVLESVLAAFKERLSSPFFGSFLISWSVLNWKFYIILLFGDDVSPRLAQFGALVFNSDYIWGHGLLYPLLAALLYVAISPFMKRTLDWYGHYHMVKAINTKNKLDGKLSNTDEEVSAMKSNFEQRIYSLQEMFDAYKRSNPTNEDIDEKHLSAFDNLLVHLAKNIVYHNNLFDYATQSAIDSTLVEYLVDVMIAKQFVSRIAKTNSKDCYIVLAKGRQYMVVNSLV